MANPKIEVEVGAKITDLQKKLKTVDSDLANTGKSFNKLNEFAVGALQGIAAAFTVGAIIDFGKAVLDTTAKFQKFEAVLTNTLGSGSEAQLALLQIQDFASKTPFAVDELTSAFVKLANQGFKPTIQELTSLGDLAASTGKSFDQLAEAIIDAQVGEFERLKEFGIRAKKEGDNVTFTFKGVETQVKATDESIRDYVLSLGDAEGVSGAMASISETLGGKLSNLGDNLEQLKLTIGNQTSGLFATSIDWLNQFISLATLASKSVSEIKNQSKLLVEETGFLETKKEVDFLVKSLEKQLGTEEAIKRAVEITKKSYQDLSDDISKGFITGGRLSFQLRELDAYGESLLKVSKAAEDVVPKLGLIGGLTEKINQLNESRVFAKDQQEITLIDSKILKLEKQLVLIDAISKRANQEIFPQVEPIKPLGLPSTDIVLPTLPGINPEKIVALREQLEAETPAIETLISQLGDAFSSLGGQIANSLNIGNDALKGFVSTLLSSTPKIITAIFQQIAAKKVKAAADLAADQSSAMGGAVVLAVDAAKGLGPVGLALLPIFLGGAMALVSGAFKKGGGGSGGGAVGAGVSGQSFTGGGVGGLGGGSRELTGELVVRGNDLVYVLGQSMNKITKG